MNYSVGDRIAIHPAANIWMRGIRYANIYKVGRKWLHCREGDHTFRLPEDLVLEKIWSDKQ